MFRLGPFELVREIAVGGMAVVHLAKVTGLGGFEKYVAVKTIHPHLAENQEFVDMLVYEAKLAVQLQHPNIAQTFDLGLVDDHYYMSMELVDGIDLYRLVKGAELLGQRLPFEACAFIGRDIAHALDHAHTRTDDSGKPLGIIHRDVSPQNVMITYDGVVKLLDFGIAKASSQLRQTDAGVIKGKFLYMSPEQTMAVPLDGRSDIYSAGIVLYELLTGRPLYMVQEPLRLIDLIRGGEFPRPTELRADIPPSLEAIVLRALATHRDERYQSAGELANDLHGFLRVHAPRYLGSNLAQLITKVFGRIEPVTPRESPAIRAELDDGLEDTICDQHSVLLPRNQFLEQLEQAPLKGVMQAVMQEHTSSPQPSFAAATPPPAVIDSSKTVLGIGPSRSPQRFDIFTLQDQLGWSVFGTVHRATCTIAGEQRVVALKRLSPQLADEPAFVERFTQELRRAVRVRHTNLVQIVKQGRDDRTHFVATELIAGVALRKLLQRSRPAPIPVVLAIVTQLLDALVAAQTAHGGVTPANVMIDERGTVKLADLGIARALHGVAPPSLATLGYLAPETALDAVVDEHTDVFSLGVIAWELIAGRRLFAGNTPPAVIGQLDDLRIAPPSRHNSKCDGALDRIVLAALARLPEQRPSSATTMRTTMELFPADRIATPAEILEWAQQRDGGDDIDAAFDNARHVTHRGSPRDDVDLDDESKIIVIERGDD